MIRLTRSQIQPIGLDIGHDSIKAIQLEVVGESLSVIAAARLSVPEEAKGRPDLRLAACVELVRQMLRGGGFVGRRVVASLPREILAMKNLRLPMMPAAELANVVKFEARNVFPFDTDAATVHYLSAGDVRQGVENRQEVLLLAARNDEVNNYLEQLHRAGAVVESLDCEPCALYRTVERFIRRREDEQEVHVLLDVGTRRSLVVIGRGREISFVKPIDLGGHHLHEAVARKLSISLEEAAALRRRLVETADADKTGRRDNVRQAVYDATRGVIEELGREISLCLRYYSVTFRGQRPGKLRLLGGEACDPQLAVSLTGALPIPVETGRPLYSVNTSRMKAADRRGPMSEWAMAFGLGLRLTAGKFGPRDGKPREIGAPVDAGAVDALSTVEGGCATNGNDVAQPPSAVPVREVAHA